MLTLSKTLPVSLPAMIMSLSCIVSAASSANSVNVAFLETSGRSFMKIKNSKGPRVEPCGTPVFIVRVVDSILFSFVFCHCTD